LMSEITKPVQKAIKQKNTKWFMNFYRHKTQINLLVTNWKVHHQGTKFWEFVEYWPH
jgi:hypothetical protein